MKRILFTASMFAALMMTVGVLSTHATTEAKKTDKSDHSSSTSQSNS